MAADPKTQGMFDRVLRQALQAITSPGISTGVAKDVQTRGPEAAVAEAVLQALQGVKGAAQKSGVELPPELMQSSAVALAQAMTSIMMDAGMTQNPDAVLKGAVQLLKGA